MLGQDPRQLYARVEAAIRALHGYEVPEILALPVVAGLPAYLEWLQASAAEEEGPTTAPPPP